jgi:hypothetical protein
VASAEYPRAILSTLNTFPTMVIKHNNKVPEKVHLENEEFKVA